MHAFTGRYDGEEISPGAAPPRKPARENPDGMDDAVQVDMSRTKTDNKRTKKEKGKRSGASKRGKEASLIRLDDLLPKRDVTGGRKSFFGSSNPKIGNTRNPKRGR